MRIHTEIAGARPLGFYQGRSSINTIRLGMEEGGFVYCADTYADDLPYWLEGPRGPQLMTPYTLDANDMRFATPQGFNTGDHFYTYLKDSFDTLYAEGDVAPKMMSIGLHCRLVGRPGRALALARFVDYALSPRSRLDSDPARHRSSLDRQAPAAGRLEAVSTRPRRCSSSASAAFMSIRPGSRRQPMALVSLAARIRPKGWRRRLPTQRRRGQGNRSAR